MWKCNCTLNGKEPSETATKLTKTEVFQDETCVRCGYYALWEVDTDKGSSSTIFKIGDPYPFCTFLNRNEAREFLNTTSGAFDNAFCKNIPYRPKGSEYILVPWICEELPEIIKDRVMVPKIYVYNKENGYLGDFTSSKAASDFTGDSRPAIRSNLARSTAFTNRNNVYTMSENFDLEKYMFTLNQESYCG